MPVWAGNKDGGKDRIANTAILVAAGKTAERKLPGKNRKTSPGTFPHLEAKMANVNQVVIIGNLVKDLDLKYTNSGIAIGSFTLAVNRDVRKNGEWLKEASFFEVESFGKQPEALKPYMTKGKQVGVEGYLKQNRWTDQQTQQTRSKIVIVANNIQLCGSRNNDQNGNDQNNAGFDDYGNY